jgi:3-methyladenine DNA glycosylase AlkD
METHEIVKDIKSRFRLYMNGIASQSMREKGLDYKVNFGIELPRLKEIASEFTPNHEVAQALWKENIRECKILAGLLQPVDTFYPEIADIWVEDMRYPEIAELTVMNLFRRLPYASSKAFEWMAAEGEYFQLCGFLLMAHLLMRGNQLHERAENELVDQALVAIEGDNLRVANAAATALCKLAAQSKEAALGISPRIAPLLASKRQEVALNAEKIKNVIESYD